MEENKIYDDKPKSFLRKHRTRSASQVAHSPRKQQLTRRITPDQSSTSSSPIKMLSPKLKVLLEKIDHVKSPEKRIRLREYADRMATKLGIVLDDGQKITICEDETFNVHIPGFHPSKSRWKDECMHDSSIVRFSIKFVYDDNVDPTGVLEGYTNVKLTGLKPGLTTVCMKQICTWIPGDRNEAEWKREILVVRRGSSFVVPSTTATTTTSSSPPSFFVKTTTTTTTTPKKSNNSKMLTKLRMLEPILRRHSESRSVEKNSDPRYDLILSRLLACIKEHERLESNLNENEMLIDYLEREQDRLSAQYHQRGTPEHDEAIARQASVMLSALDNIENETKTKAQRAAEKKQEKHLHHMIRSARSKFARFDKNDDSSLDRDELRDVVEWMWKDFHVCVLSLVLSFFLFLDVQTHAHTYIHLTHFQSTHNTGTRRTTHREKTFGNGTTCFRYV